MPTTVPERLHWAVAQLPPTVNGPVLEIGCGAGHAVPLLLARYPDAVVTGIDRSAGQIARAVTRLAGVAGAGRTRLETLDLSAAPGALGRGTFALALAINVNAFWTTPDDALPAAAELMVPGGALHLVYEPPTAERVPVLQASLARALARHGFRVADARSARLRTSTALLVVGERGPNAPGAPTA